MIYCAVAAIGEQPPAWLHRLVEPGDMCHAYSAVRERRQREILWSRGLKSALRDSCQLVTDAAGSPNQSESISHDRHYTAVVTGDCRSIGVDLQSCRSVASCLRIANQWFPEPEASEIGNQISREDSTRFMQSWVLKEAWAKCTKHSIFDACHDVSISGGQVHFRDRHIPDLGFFWSTITPEVAGLPHVTLGLCIHACENPGEIHSFSLLQSDRLEQSSLQWQRVPVARVDTVPKAVGTLPDTISR